MKDKVVVITGASSGIGAALARQVSERGGRPVLAARRQRELNRDVESLERSRSSATRNSGGGSDSRTMSFAQSAEEVAEVIVGLIEHPRADAYTRPALKEQVLRYYAAEDMAAVEQELAFRPGPPEPERRTR